jgi:hypothetical protein
MMNATFVSDEGNGDQNEHHDQDDSLFILGEIENPEQAFHLSVVQRWISLAAKFTL